MRHRIALTGVAVAAIAGFGLTVPVRAAGAATSAPAVSIHAAPSSSATSTTEAGYVLSTVPASTSESVKFTVPSLTCGPTELSGVAPGVYLFTSTFGTAASVFAVCEGGSPLYIADLVAGGTAPVVNFNPAAGDIMVASASQSADASEATLKDVTQSMTQSATGIGGTTTQMFEGIDTLIDNNTGTEASVPNFGNVVFKAAQMDGSTPAAGEAQGVNLATSGAEPQIKTRPLRRAGNKWAETFEQA